MKSKRPDITLTREQIREVDRRAIESYGIPGVVLMENAGRNSAKIILDALPRHGGSVAIVCGRGNNGGDGFVIARHLSNAGVGVELFLACDLAELKGDAATNASIARKMSIPHQPFDSEKRIEKTTGSLQAAAVVVDAVLGTGFSGDVRTPMDKVIEAINSCSKSKIIAIDVPSGLDCNTGAPSNAVVRANETITFVAKKTGFDADAAAPYVGRIHVVDIGAPNTLIQEVLGQS